MPRDQLKLSQLAKGACGLAPRRIDARSLPVLAFAVLCVLASGCRFLPRYSSENLPPTTVAQVFATNSVPVEIEDQHVVVRGVVNGRELRLTVDTGATHILLSPKAAAAAGVREANKVKIGGFGNDRGVARIGIAESVSVGPAFAEQVPLMVMRVPSVFGGDGILGMSFLKHFIFQLDYERHFMSFAPLTSSNFTGNGSSIPYEDNGRLPKIMVEVDGIPAEVLVDIGSGQALILKSSFVERHRLRERYANRLKVVTGSGLLGETRGDIVRLQSLKMGDYTMTNVFAEFESTTSAGPGEIAGFVGSAVLRKFNLTFDAHGRQLWLETNANYATESRPPASVRSGLVCMPNGTNCIVKDVASKSPAAEAGVRVGDRLLEINGVGVGVMKFVEIKNSFRAAPGTRLRLRLQANSETPREVTLTLRDLL